MDQDLLAIAESVPVRVGIRRIRGLLDLDERRQKRAPGPGAPVPYEKAPRGVSVEFLRREARPPDPRGPLRGRQTSDVLRQVQLDCVARTRAPDPCHGLIRLLGPAGSRGLPVIVTRAVIG